MSQLVRWFIKWRSGVHWAHDALFQQSMRQAALHYYGLLFISFAFWKQRLPTNSPRFLFLSSLFALRSHLWSSCAGFFFIFFLSLFAARALAYNFFTNKRKETRLERNFPCELTCHSLSAKGEVMIIHPEKRGCSVLVRVRRKMDAGTTSSTTWR